MGWRMEIKIRGLQGFTVKEQARIIEACHKMPEVLNSNLFKLAVVYAPLTETKGLKPIQVYEMLMSGADPLNDGTMPADGILDVDLVGYMSYWSKVVGWTTLGSSKSHFNRKWFGAFHVEQIGANILHEAMHRLGFTHSGVWKTSCPYFYGQKYINVFQELKKRPIVSATGLLKSDFSVSVVV
jgi:hypothetical protein